MSTDNIYHPKHYQLADGWESQDIVDQVIDGLPAKEAYYLGNILKYVIRCTKKGQLEDDIAKANNYAHRLVTGHWRAQPVDTDGDHEGWVDPCSNPVFRNGISEYYQQMSKLF